MDIRNEMHNKFRESLATFKRLDPHLVALSKLTYQYKAFAWWKELSIETPGVYIVTGGRQVGKSTSCKLLIQHAIQKKIFKPKNVFYLMCDTIYSPDTLEYELRNFISSVESSTPFLIIADEITYTPNWDRVIKALADDGLFVQGTCILTGSDISILKQAGMRFPGRRGKADIVDFHVHPLSFREYVDLVDKSRKKPSTDKLSAHFENYLKTGGYLSAINEYAENKIVTDNIFAVYQQWIINDFAKQEKSRHQLERLLQHIYLTTPSQLSYSDLNQKMGTTSKATCIEYCEFLENMDLLLTLMAFDKNNRRPFLRKRKKFHFTDPLLYHVIFYWLKQRSFLTDAEPPKVSTLVESVVANHCARYAPTYYYKSETGEIDVIWYQKPHFRAIEVKWSSMARPEDSKTLKKYDPADKNTLILNRAPMQGNRSNGITRAPLVEFLYHLPEGWPVE